MNPKRQARCVRVHTERDILTGCTKQGGWGLQVQLLATGEQQQNILFYDLLNNKPLQLQLWREGAHTSYKRIQVKMQHLMSNINLTATTTKCLLRESYGDSILCQDLCNDCYTTMIRNQVVDNLKMLIVNNATISSQKIKNHYSLPSYHALFVPFRDEVNEKCEMAICSTYGTFNTITEPILSYTQVHVPILRFLNFISTCFRCV